MERLWKRRRWLILGVLLLASVLMVGRWCYGWGGGNIDVFDFDAEDVDHIVLCNGDYDFTAKYKNEFSSLEPSVITGRKDIETIINEINCFQYAGNDLPSLLQGKIGMGGGILHEVQFHFRNGEERTFCLFTSDAEPRGDDVVMSYRFYRKGRSELIGKNARGPTEWIYDLYEKYRPIPEKETS